MTFKFEIHGSVTSISSSILTFMVFIKNSHLISLTVRMIISLLTAIMTPYTHVYRLKSRSSYWNQYLCADYPNIMNSQRQIDVNDLVKGMHGS